MSFFIKSPWALSPGMVLRMRFEIKAALILLEMRIVNYDYGRETGVPNIDIGSYARSCSEYWTSSGHVLGYFQVGCKTGQQSDSQP